MDRTHRTDRTNGLRALLMGVLLLLMSWSAAAVTFLAPPTNPVPVVNLAWTGSPDPTVTNYFVWEGTGSRQYTNKVAVGNVTNVALILPARGVTYFFTVTPFSSTGLEADWCNEVNWTPPLPPGQAVVKPPVTLAVLTRPMGASEWVATGMNWSFPPEGFSAEFKLELTAAEAAVSPQVRALAALHTVLPRSGAGVPPVPGN